jgi:hypothetical protein
MYTVEQNLNKIEQCHWQTVILHKIRTYIGVYSRRLSFKYFYSSVSDSKEWNLTNIRLSKYNSSHKTKRWAGLGTLRVITCKSITLKSINNWWRGKPTVSLKVSSFLIFIIYIINRKWQICIKTQVNFMCTGELLHMSFEIY